MILFSFFKYQYLFSIIFFCLLFNNYISSQLSSIFVNTNTNQFIDNEGRTRIFHGVNVVQKSEPYYPTDLLTNERMDLLKEMGFNVIRLGFMWIGCEPQRNYINSTYIDKIENIVNGLSNRGIYTILDAHQDLFSPKYCGDGAPLWAAIPSNNSKPFAEPLYNQYSYNNETGLPENCGDHHWSSYYLTEACSSSFQSLYDNIEGLSNEYEIFWEEGAKRFKDNSAVLGYELINEPFPGNIYENPLLLIPGIGDRINLQPFYNRLNNKIRLIDNNHIIFYEPITWDITPVGFNQVPGGLIYQNRSVLSWHYYCWSFSSDNMTPIRWGLCDLEKDDMFYIRNKDTNRLGGGQFLTEFGLCSGSNNASKFECNQVMDKADNNLLSWTYWDYSDGVFYNSSNNGKPKDYLVYDFSRTYARIVTGNIISMKFYDKTSIFTLKYNPIYLLNNPPTEIYINKQLRYSKGYIVNILPLNVATWNSPEMNIINIILDKSNQISTNDTISIEIIPKN